MHLYWWMGPECLRKRADDWPPVCKARLDFLVANWNSDRFLPFVTSAEMESKVKADGKTYVRLSETLPGRLSVASPNGKKCVFQGRTPKEPYYIYLKQKPYQTIDELAGNRQPAASAMPGVANDASPLSPELVSPLPERLP